MHLRSKAPDIATNIHVFRYAWPCRGVFLICSISCFTAAILALNSAPKNGGGFAWPAIVLALFGFFFSALLWAILPSFRTDFEGITRRRLGRRHRLMWRDIQRVEHRAASSSLILCTNASRMRIHRQIRGFIELFDIVKNSVTNGAMEPPLTVPSACPHPGTCVSCLAACLPSSWAPAAMPW